MLNLRALEGTFLLHFAQCLIKYNNLFVIATKPLDKASSLRLAPFLTNISEILRIIVLQEYLGSVDIQAMVI
jgi:hypothetical protein